MGLLSHSRRVSGDNLYESEVKPQLKPSDGHIHLVMIDSFSKLINQVFGVESKYTEQVGSIVDRLQDDGYEIVDVKFDSLKGQGLTGAAEGFHTLILYR